MSQENREGGKSEHPNAEAHRRLMERLREGGPEYAMELAREAGIVDEHGELTEPYKRLLREDEEASRQAS